MSLAVDAMQPSFVRGLLSLRGRATISNLPDVVTSSRRHGFDLDFSNPNRVLIDFREPNFIASAIGGDASRFSIAAFVSLSNITGLGRANNFAWEMIKLYYAAFYAGHSILRFVGQSCSHFDANHISTLQHLAAIIDPTTPLVLNSGTYHCILNVAQTGFSMTRAQAASGGDHAAFWKVFSAFLATTDESVLRGHLAPSDARSVFLKLSALQVILNGGGSGNGNWLSRVRNDLQYRHSYKAWPPSSIKQASRDALLRLGRQWRNDPMAIDLEYPPGGEFGMFVSACSFLVALCCALVGRLSFISSAGANSFAKVPLQYCS